MSYSNAATPTNPAPTAPATPYKAPAAPTVGAAPLLLELLAPALLLAPPVVDVTIELVVPIPPLAPALPPAAGLVPFVPASGAGGAVLELGTLAAGGAVLELGTLAAGGAVLEPAGTVEAMAVDVLGTALVVVMVVAALRAEVTSAGRAEVTSAGMAEVIAERRGVGETEAEMVGVRMERRERARGRRVEVCIFFGFVAWLMRRGGDVGGLEVRWFCGCLRGSVVGSRKFVVGFERKRRKIDMLARSFAKKKTKSQV